MEAAQVTMEAVYAWAGTLLEVAIREPLPPGDYCAQLSLRDAATGAHDETECLALSVTPVAGSLAPEDDGPASLPTALPGTDALGSASSAILVVTGGVLLVLAFLLAVQRRGREQRTTTAVGKTRS